MGKKVTMQQIADYLGVSKFVVSKALSGKKGVRPITRDKVIKVATQLGYFINKAPAAANGTTASGPKKSDNQTIVVLMPNIRLQTKESTYWGKILEGISEELGDQGLGLVIITDNSIENFANILNPQGFLGIIGVGMVSTSILLEIHNLGIPLVSVDHDDPLIPADTVFMNNFESTFRLTNYLLGLGHKNIEFLGNIHYAHSFHERWLGFRSSLEENGFSYDPSMHQELTSYRGDHDDHITLYPNVEEWLDKRIKENTLPSAFVCANDSIALKLIQQLQNRKIKVPDEVSVTGFDNIDDSIMYKPSLTTVNVSKEFLGKRAVEMLLWRIEHKEEPIQQLVVSGNVMIRESTSTQKKLEQQMNKNE